MGPGTLSPGPVPVGSSDSASAAETERIEATVPGGPVLGVFRAEPDRIDQILEGLDDEMVMTLARAIRRVAPFAESESSAEERWRQFMASTIADEIRGTVEPFMEHLQLHQAEFDGLFSQAFTLSSEAVSPVPFETEPSPREIRSWSAVIILWIGSAAGGYWIGTDFHMGVIFTVLLGLLVLFDRCFE